MFLVGTLDDLTLFTHYLLMQADAPPFNVASVRARIRRDVQSGKDLSKRVARTWVSAEEAGVLRTWIASQASLLAEANRRHMSAMLRRLTFEQH